MRHTVGSIRERYNRFEALDFVLFWGHTAKEGRITQACLSQFYPCTFTDGEMTYCCAEQWMMASKARYFGDTETLEKIMAATKPQVCKSLGRQVKGFDPERWDQVKYDIVLQGNLMKFSQNEPLRNYLLGTKDAVLVEASPMDGIWGIHMGRNDPNVRNPNFWEGENLLGFALMETRERLAAS